jgi:hypothetical protein
MFCRRLVDSVPKKKVQYPALHPAFYQSALTKTLQLSALLAQGLKVNTLHLQRSQLNASPNIRDTLNGYSQNIPDQAMVELFHPSPQLTQKAALPLLKATH